MIKVKPSVSPVMTCWLPRLLVLAVAIVGPTGDLARGQLVEEFEVPRANCCLLNAARSLADQLQDWNQLGRYHEANLELAGRPVPDGRVVFMGDSITDGWNLAESFPGKPYVNRGIGGQTTAQMLVRMYPDVIRLEPAAMVLLAGTNDIARNTGPVTAEMIQQNIMAMTELAQLHGIDVLLSSVMPISDYPFLRSQNERAPAGLGGRGGPPRVRMTDGRPPEDILALNAWIRAYADEVGAAYVDYFSVMVDDRGWLGDQLSGDGLHPNAAGYAVMNAVVSAALERVLP